MEYENFTSIECFLREPEFVRYAPYLKEFGFTSVKMLKFLKLKYLLKLPSTPPEPYRRMLLYEIVKVHSPEAKTKVETESPDSEDVAIKKRKKDYETTTDRANNLEPRQLFDQMQRSPQSLSSTTPATSLSQSNTSQGITLLSYDERSCSTENFM